MSDRYSVLDGSRKPVYTGTLEQAEAYLTAAKELRPNGGYAVERFFPSWIQEAAAKVYNECPSCYKGGTEELERGLLLCREIIIRRASEFGLQKQPF